MLAFVLLTCEQKGCFTGLRAPSAAASINYDKGAGCCFFSELSKGLVSAVYLFKGEHVITSSRSIPRLPELAVALEILTLSLCFELEICELLQFCGTDS